METTAASLGPLSAGLVSNSSYPSLDEISQELRLESNDTYLKNGLLESTVNAYAATVSRDSLYVVVPVTIIYVSIFITGTIGNISTCIVIARNKSMHTATNYYLFSLAVSDLLLLVSGLPPEIYMVWCKYPYIFGEGFCVLRGLAAETSTNASVLTITAFTVERYLAICHPFLAQTMSKLSRAIKLILVVWLVALSFALPQALQFGVVTHEMNPNMVACTVKTIIVEHSFELSTFLFFIVPMSLITVLYALIGLKLRKSNTMKRDADSGEAGKHCRHHAGRSSRRVLKMLVAVVVAFFICWAPFHVQRLVAIYGTNKDDHITSNSKWMEFLYLLFTYVSGVFYYVSTTINPILYNIMSNKFRVAFMETLSRSCRLPGLAFRHEQRSYSSLSRSQQRTVGAYGSRTIGTGGTGLAHDSTDCSGNSGKDETPRQTHSLIEQPAKNGCQIVDPLHDDGTPCRKPRSLKNKEDTKGSRRKESGSGRGQRLFDEKSRNRERERERERGRGREERSSRRRLSRFAAVKVTNMDGSEKKWWRIFKWLPGLKSLKFTGRTTYAMPESKVLEEIDSNREEFSMTMRNAVNGSEQRPV